MFGKIKEYVRTKIWPDVQSRTKLESDYYAVRQKLFLGEQGLLKYKNTRFCVPNAYQLDIIKGMHTLGHLGVRQTRAQLERHYFWPGMRGAVEEFVRQCVGCAKRAGAPAKVDSGIEVTRANQPWELVSMDLMGPFAEGPKRTKFVLSVMDVYTRYLELVTPQNPKTPL